MAKVLAMENSELEAIILEWMAGTEMAIGAAQRLKQYAREHGYVVKGCGPEPGIVVRREVRLRMSDASQDAILPVYEHLHFAD